MVWEQEIYNDFNYVKARPFFHMFEAHDCPAGLNFANEFEADNFATVVQNKVEDRRQRRNRMAKKANQTKQQVRRSCGEAEKLLFVLLETPPSSEYRNLIP